MSVSSAKPSMEPNISAVSMLSGAARRTSNHSTVTPADGHTVANSAPGSRVVRDARPSTLATTRNASIVPQPGRSATRARTVDGGAGGHAVTV